MSNKPERDVEVPEHYENVKSKHRDGTQEVIDPELQAVVDQYNEQVTRAYELLEQVAGTGGAKVLQRVMPVAKVRLIHISQVQANDYNPNSVAHQEMNLLHTSISEDGYCVEQSTPILMADLTWQPAGLLQVGDEIVAFDEEPSPNATNTKHSRKFRKGVVISNYLEEEPLWEVTTDRGVIKVTGDHPFLGQHVTGTGSNRTLRWITAEELVEGDRLVHFFTPWEQDFSYEAGWMAGVLEGEGSLAQNQRAGHAPHVRLSGYQRPSTTADKMLREMRKYVPNLKVFTVKRAGGKNPWSDMVMARVDRMLDIMKFLGTVRPERLLEQGPFWEGTSIALQDTRATVLNVRQIEKGTIARLSTSTKTYIADGFAVHNTQPVVSIWDPTAGPDRKGRYIIVDGFHRFTTMRRYEDIFENSSGYLPVVVLEKDIADRIASTVRHNRARGKHSTQGMGTLVFQMLEAGENDETICKKLGLEAEEIARLKHVTGYSKLYRDVEFSPVVIGKTQIEAKAAYKKEHPNEHVPSF